MSTFRKSAYRAFDVEQRAIVRMSEAAVLAADDSDVGNSRTTSAVPSSALLTTTTSISHSPACSKTL